MSEAALASVNIVGSIEKPRSLLLLRTGNEGPAFAGRLLSRVRALPAMAPIARNLRRDTDNGSDQVW